MSSLPTLIRIKRRLDEEPSPVLVVAGKKRKLEQDGASESFTHTLSLAGTISDKNDIFNFASKDELLKSQRKIESIKRNEPLRKRLADDTTATSAKRFKIMEDAQSYKNFCLVDFHEDATPSSVTVNDVEMVRESVKPREEFVFDLYFTPAPIDYIDGPVTVQYYHDLVVDDSVEPDVDEDSEDENRENYYTNEYPSTPEQSDDDDIYGDGSFTEKFSRFVIDDPASSGDELETWEDQMRRMMDKKEDNSDSDDDSDNKNDYDDY